MSKRVRIIPLVFAAAILYYGLQYASSAVHYNCYALKDDCVPPINAVSELIYRVMVQPPWLDRFEIEPTAYFFQDGQFSFWEGKVDGEPVVIRVRQDGSPVMQWIEMGLPLKIPIYPADGERVRQWLKEHPEFALET